jgi:hypothetical protein
LTDIDIYLVHSTFIYERTRLFDIYLVKIKIVFFNVKGNLLIFLQVKKDRLVVINVAVRLFHVLVNLAKVKLV